MPARDTFRHRNVEIDGGTIHAVEIGPVSAPVVVFLHGWPQSWLAFRKVMALAGDSMHAVALDLPGIGASRFPGSEGSKRAIARMVRQVIQALGLARATLVGHDIGGQVTYAYLSQFGEELERAVILDVAVPGVDPWSDVLRNPHIWHFAFHGLPELPEQLIEGRQRLYFDFFYEALAAQPEAIDAEMRHAYAEAYESPEALKSGFEWYRAFDQDAKDNEAFAREGGQIRTPLLYLRGDRGGMPIDRYVEGFRESGVRTIHATVLDDCGHFLPEEQPVQLWQRIAAFMADTR